MSYSPPRELYLYYKIPSSSAAACRAAVRQWQQRLVYGQPGLVARLLQRDDPANASTTLMETYAGPVVDVVFAQRLEAEAAALLQALGLGATVRHAEWFTPCA